MRFRKVVSEILKTETGYVSIETVIVLGVIVLMGWDILSTWNTSVSDIAEDVINDLRLDVGLAKI